jgi:hypothetical protein
LRKALIPVAAVLVVLVAAVAATAAIPDANGVIHGCRNTKSGALRVIDTDKGQTCGKDEAALSWNQTGPQGPAGVSGHEVLVSFGDVSDGDPSRDSALFKVCPAGKRAIGGGGGALNAAGSSASRPDVVLQSSNPYDFDGDGSYRAWRVQMRRIGDTTEGYAIRMWVVCASVS